MPGQATRLGNPTPDYLLPNAARWSTTAYRRGSRASVTASSSMSDAFAVGNNQPGQLPYAAIDGRQETRWRAELPTRLSGPGGASTFEDRRADVGTSGSRLVPPT